MSVSARWLLVAFIPFLVQCGQNLAHGNESEKTVRALPDETGQEGADRELLTPAVRARGSEVQSRGWTEPSYTAQEETQILKQYAGMDPNHEIPTNLLKKTILYFHKNQDLIPNKNFLLVVDFSISSRKSRMFMLNLKTGAVGTMRTAHGKGSDPNNDGYADRFSNLPDSNMSSLGFFLTGEVYDGAHGYSLRIDGLSNTNSKVRDRAVVIHGADYVVEQNTKQGRSLGCFVLAWENRTYVIDRVREGALMYAGLSSQP